MPPEYWISGLFVLLVVSAAALVRWGTRWGSTPAERARALPGDEYLAEGQPARVAMTRGISIGAPTERVWSWIAQLGRGAGWCSIDRLDNGGRASAWHIVSWIPEPRLGDATAIGYLRRMDVGRSMVWWADGVRFLGARARLVTCLTLTPEGGGSRLVSRYSADAAGSTAHLALFVFRMMDSIMARRQLLGIRDRVERAETDRAVPGDKETGDRAQYQLHQVLYAEGGGAGVAGKESAARWRESARTDGFLREEAQGQDQPSDGAL